MPGFVVAGLLLGHALIHASYLSPEPARKPGAPAWPFHVERSWLLGPIGFDRATSRLLGTGLVVLVIAGFALAAIASLGAGPAWLWPIGVALGAIASLAVLILYFHPWLVLGLVIDVLLLWVVVIAGWTPTGLGT
jgi:hypothetical protein